MQHRPRTPATTRPRTSTRIVRAAPALLAVALAAACTSSEPAAPEDRGPAPASSGPTAGPGDERRPAIHLTPRQHWMNDPQRPFFKDGRWHLYYLYNADHPTGNGTSWYHVTSTDLVHWKDEGVAIEKYANGLGDIQTGSAVVDEEDTAGFGRGAVVALVTQQDDGVQRQSLFYSTDGGHSFEPYAGNPVMDNPGAEDWRDPKVVWDDEHSQWVMVLAEGRKLGFYTSPDLKTWTYRSGFERSDLGLLECPDLFRMSVDGDPDRTTWVLAASADGAAHGRSHGLAYWTGSWDGSSFTPDRQDPSWLDSGSDFYAAVTWEDPRLDEAERQRSRYAIGWMNNWSYARDLPAADWAGGMLSVPRRLSLTSAGGTPQLRSTPVESMTVLEDDPRALATGTVTAGAPREVQPGPAPYRLRVRIEQSPERPSEEVRVRVSDEVTVGYDFADRTAFVVRDHRRADGLPEAYDQVRTAPATPRGAAVELDVLVDRSSVEAFVNGGEASFSMLDYGDPAPDPVTFEAVGGDVRLAELSVSPLDDAAPRR